MEAPKPVQLQINSPKPYSDEEKISFFEELIINQGDESYKLILGKDEIKNNLVIKLIVDKSKEIYYFQNKFNMNELQNLSEIFSFYKSIEVIISFLKTLKYEIIEKEEDLSFNLFMPNGQNQLIELNLQKILIDSQSIINYLLKENKILKGIITKNSDEISNLKETIFELNNKVLNLEQFFNNRITMLENNNIKIEKKIKEENNIFLDSKIVSSIDEIQFILDYIRTDDTSFRFNKLNLLYRGSRDGDSTKTCHLLCDYKTNILIIIYSDNGYKFGGYCKIGFKFDNQKNYTQGKDNNSFIYSINFKRIYPAIKDKYVIYYDNDSWGLCFTDTLRFHDNFMKNSYSIIGYSAHKFFNDLDKPSVINGGSIYFKCKDLEVFQFQ